MVAHQAVEQLSLHIASSLGGHVSTEGITAITNIPNVARELDVPLIAAASVRG